MSRNLFIADSARSIVDESAYSSAGSNLRLVFSVAFSLQLSKVDNNVMDKMIPVDYFRKSRVVRNKNDIFCTEQPMFLDQCNEIHTPKTKKIHLLYINLDQTIINMQYE